MLKPNRRSRIPARHRHPAASPSSLTPGLLRNTLLLIPAALLLTPGVLHAQLPAGTTDASSSSSSQPQRQDPLRTEAAEALDHRDFNTALRLLTALAEKNPTDSQVLFDLASVQDALDQATPAEATYRRAIAADPNLLEPHVALGLLLARTNHPAEARTELTAATTLNPSAPASPEASALKARALRALAHLDASSDPAAARDALLAALKLSPETPDDTLLSAELAEQAHDAPGAEAAYRRLLARTPNDPAATASLAHLLLAENKADDAQRLLTDALAAHPNDPALSAQLASVYIRQDKTAEATTLLETLHTANPSEPAVTRLYARLLSQSGQYDRSEPLLAALVARSPTDLSLLDDDADALIHLKRSPEAERLLRGPVFATSPSVTSSSPQSGDLASAATHLAFAASQNNNPDTTLRALNIRATLLPQSAPSLFLEATAHDKLHHVKQAQDLYKRFLSVANGKYPDEEWEARHRLITLEHMK